MIEQESPIPKMRRQTTNNLMCNSTHVGEDKRKLLQSEEHPELEHISIKIGKSINNPDTVESI